MDILRSSNPTARKNHKCDLCNGTIEKGEKYKRTTIADEGIYDFVCHCHCSELVNILNIYDNEGYIDPEYFNDAIFDYIEEHHYDKETGCVKPYRILPFSLLVEKIYNELKTAKNILKSW